MLPPAFWLSSLLLASIIPQHQVLALSNFTHSSTSRANASDTPEKGSATTGGFKLSLVNLLGTSNMHAYVTGQDIDGKLLILNAAGSNWVTPQATLPSVIYSARVWLAEGYLPFSRTEHADNKLGLVQPSVNPQDSSINADWGFVEFSYNASNASAGMTADLSYVDFVGLPLGIALNDSNASRAQTKLGLKKTAVADICDDLKSKPPPDGQPWDQLCVHGVDRKPFRVLAPIHYMAKNSSAFQRTMTCTNDEAVYKQPNATDVFSCNSGDFANIDGTSPVHQRAYPRLCAAWNRGCMMSATQPCAASAYYPNDTTPQNWYSRIVHEHLSGGQGYAFSYDDHYKNGERDPSGLLKSENPTALTIWVGGHPDA
ncbi:hypothetical protein EJ03DRAFT_346344 [Teratosphaeria nubilosa]|uniref:GH64 domain-containing protein n=1 Tax=Teratosphaeria nubilosa TaxID=161662 RepID=A0A6G1KW40_9PEZI|nr:hypothetical protein EJ03DRAFT_346344 [Teratosphaeria nubilosa]